MSANHLSQSKGVFIVRVLVVKYLDKPAHMQCSKQPLHCVNLEVVMIFNPHNCEFTAV